jgi:hypothetical protein
MATPAPALAPRLHRDPVAYRFWGVCCLIAFVLAFVLGSFWAERRAVQDMGFVSAAYDG